MNNLFLGMLFVFLDFNITLGSATLGLIPDFVGYFLMVKGLEELMDESSHFAKAKPLAMVMAAYTAVLYAMDLFAVSVQLRFIGWVLGVVSMIVSLYISYRIVQGVLEIEGARFRDLQGQKLKTMWTAMAAIQGICYVCGWIPLVGEMGALAAFIIGICYLVAFHKTKTLYLS